jgi:hypothetical protein
MGDPFALALVQTTPDPDRLIDGEGIVEARTPHDAGGTDRFRLKLALESLMAVLRTLGWEEHLCVRATTGCSQLP